MVAHKPSHCAGLPQAIRELYQLSMPSKLETSIDKFVSEILKHGKLTFKEASSILGISEEQVEQWAKLLNQHKEETGIEIHYPRLGEPEIVAREFKKGTEVKEKIQAIEEEKGELEEILEQYSGGKIPEKVEMPKKAAEPKERVQKPEIKAEVAIKEVKELEKKIGEVKEVGISIGKMEKELQRAETEERELERAIESAKQRISALQKATFLLIDTARKRMDEAKRVEMGVQGVKALREDLKRIESEIRDIQKLTKSYDHLRIKERLINTLQGVLGREKKPSKK